MSSVDAPWRAGEIPGPRGQPNDTGSNTIHWKIAPWSATKMDERRESRREMKGIDARGFVKFRAVPCMPLSGLEVAD